MIRPLAIGIVVATLLPAACSGSASAPTPSTAATSSTPAPSSAATTAPKTARPTAPRGQPMPAGPACVRGDSGACLPIAPARQRVDLVRPVFSRPTAVTNPLHPSGTLRQVLYGGQVDGEPFRTEFTRLPGTKRIDWQGRRIDAVSWQYLAFSGGRIHEVAVDWFAQADDGSVWYLGEDVFNYADGRVVDTDGSWLAGRDGPPAMIMPAMPKPGAVYRPENAPGVVFEEVRVKSTGLTVPGPSGPVRDAMIVTELHLDGTYEQKTFAPGYGEFSTGSPGADLEAASLAIPTDARPGPVPAALQAFARAAHSTYDAVAAKNWRRARTSYDALRAAWTGDRTVLGVQTRRDLDALGRAITARASGPARDAALRVAQDDLDLRLRHLPLPAIERARFDLWRRQTAVDAAHRDSAGVAGDIATLRWTWPRVRPTVPPATAAKIDALLQSAAQGDTTALTRLPHTW